VPSEPSRIWAIPGPEGAKRESPLCLTAATINYCLATCQGRSRGLAEFFWNFRQEVIDRRSQGLGHTGEEGGPRHPLGSEEVGNRHVVGVDGHGELVLRPAAFL